MKLLRNKNFLFITSIILAIVFLYFVINNGVTENFTTGKSIVMFHLPGCVHCEILMPVFNKLMYDLKKNTKITLTTVNGNDDAGKKYNINGYPTVVYIKDGVILDTYEGDRTYEDLKRFVEKSIRL